MDKQARLILGVAVVLAWSCKTPHDSSSSAASSEPSASRPSAYAQAAQKAQQQAMEAEGGTRPKEATPPVSLALTNAAPLAPTAPDYIGSCRVAVGRDEYCLQDSKLASLFYCSGLISKAACDQTRYKQTCKHTPNQTHASIASVLLLYTTNAKALPISCDNGSLQAL